MAQIGYVYSLWLLVGICAVFLPVGFFGMDRCGHSSSERLVLVPLFPSGSLCVRKKLCCSRLYG